MQFARATSAKFEAAFLDQDGAPLTCANPEMYPSIAVKDPNNTTVATGLGRLIGNGKYVFSWYVPEDAEINTRDRPWSIAWFFLTDTGHNKDHEESFHVVDKVEPTPEERKWTYLAKDGTYERLFLTLPYIPEELSVELLGPGNTSLMNISCVTESLKAAMLETPVASRKISYMKRDGRYHFFVDTDPLNFGEYLVFWYARETLVSPREPIQQLLRVPETIFWHLLQPMRMLIDKLQKRTGWVQSYSDSDIYEYLVRGVDLANMVQPTTNWSLGTIPLRGSRGVIDAVLLFAAIWGLIAQQILEEELKFDFGGQTVTLNYAHDYSGILGNINDILGRFAESKQHIYRIANGPGRVGVRPKNWRFTQRVWRVDNWGFGSPYDVSVLMTSVGL